MCSACIVNQKYNDNRTQRVPRLSIKRLGAKFMKRILVTGGAGFIGSHLCKKLLEMGASVICLDNFYSSSILNVKHLLRDYSPQFELVRHDIAFPYYAEVDEIYNLACPASPVHYQRNPVMTMKTSILGAVNMLGLAKRTGAKILQASTSEVYGDPLVHPQIEGYYGNVNPIGIRSCYDEGKRAAESLFMDYHRQYSTKTKIARIFNTYGPGMLPNDGRVVSNFIVQALKDESITIYGDGKQTRSFCYVSDLIEGLLLLMDTWDGFLGPVNLGNPVEITMSDLAEMIIRVTYSKSTIGYYKLPSDDPTRRKPDISIAKRELHWEPTVSLRRGLEDTIEYFRERNLSVERI